MPDPLTEYFREEADHANLVAQTAWKMGLVVTSQGGPAPPPPLNPDGSLAQGWATANTFCATGEGGGIDPTCSPKSVGGGPKPIKLKGVSTKDPATMTAGQINKERAALREHASKFGDKMIEAGRGHETPRDYHPKTDELSELGKTIDKRFMALRVEMDLRYGPGLIGDLPKNFGPRTKPGTVNSWLPAPGVTLNAPGRSHFAVCKRDPKGHCLPGEGGGDEDDDGGPAQGAGGQATGGASSTKAGGGQTADHGNKKAKPGFDPKAKTHEGVTNEEAAHLTLEQARAVIKYKEGFAPIYIHGANVPNKALPDATRPQLDDHERGALQKYTFKNDIPLNARLRGKADWGDKTPYNETYFQELHGGLQSAFGKAKVMDKPVEVVRGMFKGKDASDPAVQSFVQKAMHAADNGGTVRMEGYTSTTRPDSLGYKMGLKGATGDIKEPFRGAVAIKINAVHGLDMNPHSQLPGEKEFLLNHDSQFKVKKVVKTKAGYEIHLDQVAPTQHAKDSTALNRRYTRDQWQTVTNARNGKGKMNPDKSKADGPDTNEATDAEMKKALRKVYEDNPECRDKFLDADASHVTFETPGADEEK